MGFGRKKKKRKKNKKKPFLPDDIKGRFAGELRGRIEFGQQEIAKEFGQQYSHDYAETHERVHAVSSRSTEAIDGIQDAKRLGRIQIRRSNVLVADIACG